MTSTHASSPEFTALAPSTGRGFPAAEVIDAEVVHPLGPSLRDYLRIVQRHRRLALGCFAATLGLTALALVLWPRTYTATTRLQISRQSPIQLRLADNVLRVDENDRTVNGSSVFLSTQVEALQSRDLAERVVRRYGLAANDAFTHPRRGDGTLLDVALPAAFRPRGWSDATPAEGAASTPGPIDPDLLDRYADYVSVRDLRGTDLVELTVATPRPDLSALLAAAHAQAYLDAVDEARHGTNLSAEGFLGTQLQASQQQLEHAEAALQAFAEEHPDVALNQERELVAKKMELLATDLSAAEAARVELETRYETLTRPGADASPYFVDQPGVEKLHLALLDIQAQRAALDPRLGPKHPQMVELRAQEAALARQLRAEFRQQVASVRTKFDAVRRREDVLREKLGREQKEVIALRNLGLRYDFLHGEVQTARALHESLMKQRVQTAVNSELAASNVRLVERAELPVRASSPNLPLFGAVGLLLGLVFGAGAPLARELLDDSVRSVDEAQGLLGIPTIATIPADPMPLRALAQPASSSAEAFRSLRTAILSAPVPPKIILVASAVAGEGKTQVSTNLAAALAETGARTLLVDVDLRKPECHRVLGLDAGRGLSSVLQGRAGLAEVTQRLADGGAYVIPAGPPVANAATLLSSPRMHEALDALAGAFDFIVLDTPPVLPVADAAMLARAADGVVLVVKGQDTPRDLVLRARDQLVQAGGRLLGTVVNHVAPEWTAYDAYVRRYTLLPHAEDSSAA